MATTLRFASAGRRIVERLDDGLLLILVLALLPLAILLAGSPVILVLWLIAAITERF